MLAPFLLLVLRLLVAFLLVAVCIFLGWFLAWKLILVHIPLVQEICGLRKKPKEPRPTTGRLSRLYSDNPQQTPRRPGNADSSKLS